MSALINCNFVCLYERWTEAVSFESTFIAACTKLKYLYLSFLHLYHLSFNINEQRRQTSIPDSLTGQQNHFEFTNAKIYIFFNEKTHFFSTTSKFLKNKNVTIFRNRVHQYLPHRKSFEVNTIGCETGARCLHHVCITQYILPARCKRIDVSEADDNLTARCEFTCVTIRVARQISKLKMCTPWIWFYLDKTQSIAAPRDIQCLCLISGWQRLDYNYGLFNYLDLLFNVEIKGIDLFHSPRFGTTKDSLQQAW